MSKVIKVDFLFERLCRDVSSFYDKYYFGRDKDNRKGTHLTILKDKYLDKSFSTNPVVLEREVKNFLQLVQNYVDGYDL